jgi:hypothetical protein
MKLEIVWRNPLPLARTEHELHKVSRDDFRAVYSVVTDLNPMQEFELIVGAA